MKSFLSILVLICLFFGASGQIAITNFSGTTTYGSESVTVTSTGGVSTWSGCLGPPTEYWIGFGTSGGYIYTLSRPVYTITLQGYALNTGEYMSLYINGAFYNITAADMVAYTSCGAGGGPVFLSGGSVWGPAGGGYNAPIMAVHTCTPINSFELYCVTNSGITYHVQVDTTAPTCFHAAANSPCEHDSLRLYALGDSTGATYLWSGPAGFSSTRQNPFRYPSTMADTGFYTVIRTVGGIPDTDIVHVVITPMPTIGLSSNAPICIGVTDTLHLSVTPYVTGETFLWSGPSGFTSTLEFPDINGVTTLDSGIYTVAVNLNGCIAYGAISVTINPAPVNPMWVGDTVYCQFDTYVPFLVTGSHVRWYSVPTGGYGNPVQPIVNTLLAGVTHFYITQTNDTTGCESNRVPITVTVNAKPDPPIVTNPVLCQYDSAVQLTAIGTNLTWYMGGSASPLATAPTPATDHPSITDYFVTQTVLGCVSDKILDRVTVVEAPSADLYIKKDICVGDTISIGLTSHTASATVFNWLYDGYSDITNDGGIIVAHSSASGGPFKAYWGTAGVHIIELDMFTQEGCKGKAMIDSVIIHPRPDAGFALVRGEAACAQDSVKLQARTEKSSSLYVWEPTHFFENSNKSSVWGRIEFPGYVTLTVTDAYGCDNSDSTYFNPGDCCVVSFPSAFTPNGDGKNDFFRPIFKGFHRFHEFRIADRWGETIFQSNNNDVEWDGTHNGDKQDMGVYFYYIKFDCGGATREAHGDITLIR